MDQTVRLAGLTLRNPVMTASGTFGYGAEYADFVDLNRLGAIVVKGLSLAPRDGNPPPRTVETPSGMLNSVGLQNPGAAAFIADKLPYLAKFDTPVIVNLNASFVEEYGDLTALFDAEPGVAAMEVNISCPNVKQGGAAFSADPCLAEAVTRQVREHTNKPVIVKLSPIVTSIADLAKSVEAAGADAVSVINTLVGMVIDVERRHPVLANVTGGLSGPAVRPVAVRCVWDVYRAIKLPIVGLGGITSGADALQFIEAGASAVAVGTQSFIDPCAGVKVADELAAWGEAHGLGGWAELVGAAHG